MAARECEKASTQMIEHADMGWRHVALLPVFSRDSKLTDLSPVLSIYIETHTSVASATSAMQERLAELTSQLGVLLEYI
ncbi:hypothetical protein EON63_15900 [archaeon]|nr:MAG: hypothetical protein EON63_15900 [archaeon]